MWKRAVEQWRSRLYNGAAATLLEAVEFYDTRFAIGFTLREKADLVGFPRTL